MRRPALDDRLANAAVTLILVAAAASCAAPADRSADAPGKAADGETISGTGYSYAAPEGWGVPPQDVPGFDPDSLVMNLDDDDSFKDNINTIVDTSVPASMSLDELESEIPSALERFGAEDPNVEDRLEVAGQTALHVTSRSSVGGEHDIDTYYVTNGSDWVAVTLSTNDLTYGERRGLAESVLATWQWD